MQSLSPISLGIAGLVVLIVLALVWGFRGRIFGKRLNMAGAGRARQPRLGVVDAFDLDRQRQLVLIRRDNVEHLVMIGGPNDLVIETAIIRAQVAAPGRDKDGTSPGVLPPAAVVQGAPAPASALPPTIPAEPVVSRPTPATARPEAPPAPPPSLQETRTPPPPVRTPPAFPPRQPLTPPSTLPRQPVTTRPQTGPALPPRTPLSATRPSPLARVTSAASSRRDDQGSGQLVPSGEEAGPEAPVPVEPVGTAVAPSPAPVPLPVPEILPPSPSDTAPPAPATASAPTDSPRPAPPTIPTTLDTLESLEEEMAKLLGRSVSDKA